MADRYNVSKLLEVFACRQVAKEHPVSQTNVTLNFVNPGWCHSELMREMMNPVLAVLKKIMYVNRMHRACFAATSPSP